MFRRSSYDYYEQRTWELHWHQPLINQKLLFWRESCFIIYLFGLHGATVILGKTSVFDQNGLINSRHHQGCTKTEAIGTILRVLSLLCNNGVLTFYLLRFTKKTLPNSTARLTLLFVTKWMKHNVCVFTQIFLHWTSPKTCREDRSPCLFYCMQYLGSNQMQRIHGRTLLVWFARICYHSMNKCQLEYAFHQAHQ
jgi:hypothetical protein